MITTAVLLAAGRGARLGALTAENPKPLLRIGVDSVIDRIVVALRDLGLTRIVVVTGHLAERIESHLGAAYRGLVQFARQDRPRGTADALRCAAGLLDPAEPFFLGWGDIVTSPEDYADVLAAWQEGADAIVGVNRLDDPSAGASVVLTPDWKVTALVEKPPPGEAPSTWNNAGLMVFSPAVWDHLGGLVASPRGELELTDGLNAMIAAERVVRAAEVLGPWFDIGTPKSLAAAREVYG